MAAISFARLGQKPTDEWPDLGAAQPDWMHAFTLVAFSYTGPRASIVHVRARANDGEKIYADGDETFSDLPADLIGADWIQIADADQAYSAADLIQLTVKAGVTLTIAHDGRLGVPEWLARQFAPTGRSLKLRDGEMQLFQRHTRRARSFTLGSNTDASLSRFRRRRAGPVKLPDRCEDARSHKKSSASVQGSFARFIPRGSVLRASPTFPAASFA